MLLLSSADFFSKPTLSKNSFRNTIRVLNRFDPEQVQHSDGPDLGPNCLQSYQQMTKIAACNTRGVWKVLSMVYYLSNQFTNLIMFGIILKNYLSSM